MLGQNCNTHMISHESQGKKVNMLYTKQSQVKSKRKSFLFGLQI